MIKIYLYWLREREIFGKLQKKREIKKVGKHPFIAIQFYNV